MREMCEDFETDDNLMVCALLPGQLHIYEKLVGEVVRGYPASHALFRGCSVYMFYALLRITLWL